MSMSITNEQVGRDAIYNMGNLDMGNLADQCSGAVVAALKAAGRLTQLSGNPGQFTEAQVEAAVHGAWVKSREFRGAGGQAEFAPPWEFQQVIRAALASAQDAAPQDSGKCGGCRDLGPHRNVSGCQYYEAPVPPSSDVDEDKLAEVIAKSRGFGNGWEQIPPLTREAYREVARAVAEWLKGQGR